MKLNTIIACFALFLGACGDDDSKDSAGSTIEDPATVEKSKETSTASEALTTLPTGTDDSMAKGPIVSVGQSIQTWVGQHQASKAMAMAQGLEQATLAQTNEGGTYSFEDGHLSART